MSCSFSTGLEIGLLWLIINYFLYWNFFNRIVFACFFLLVSLKLDVVILRFIIYTSVKILVIQCKFAFSLIIFQPLSNLILNLLFFLIFKVLIFSISPAFHYNLLILKPNSNKLTIATNIKTKNRCLHFLLVSYFKCITLVYFYIVIIWRWHHSISCWQYSNATDCFFTAECFNYWFGWSDIPETYFLVSTACEIYIWWKYVKPFDLISMVELYLQKFFMHSKIKQFD